MSTDSRTLFDDANKDPNIINLVMGAPPVSYLSRNASADFLGKATEHLLSQDVAKDGSIVQYGPRVGSSRFLNELAKFLSSQYQDKVEPKNLCNTGGATHGMFLACSIFFKAGATVFVEDPTYFIAINIVKNDLGYNVVPVRRDDTSMDIDHLEELLEANIETMKANRKEGSPFNGMVYVIPTYHNPTSKSMPADRCQRLIKLARKYDVLLFCDDVYNVLHYDMETIAPPRLLTYDNTSDSDYKGHVLSNGTFSKFLGPGMRVGWIESSDRVIKSLHDSAILWSAGASNHFGAEIIASMLQLNLQQDYLLDMRKYYSDIFSELFPAMREKFPSSVKFFEPKGGYFLWLEMPENCKGADVAKLALSEFNVRVLPGQACSATGSYQNCLRISYSSQPKDVLLDGIDRLGKAMHKYMDSLK